MARLLVGTVVSDKMEKTVCVLVSSQRQHRLYHKAYTVTKKYLAHNPQDKAKMGDLVQLVETKPMSRRKRFLINAILQKHEGELQLPEFSDTKARSRTAESKSEKSAAKQPEESLVEGK